MENIPTNEANGKWRAKLQKWTKRVIVLGVIYGLGWLFFPLLGVVNLKMWASGNSGVPKKISDYYHVNIGGITYAKDKFYVLLSKPYLFNRGYGYIYSSKDLLVWVEEVVNEEMPIFQYSPVTSFYKYNDYQILESNGHVISKRFNSDDSNYHLPRQVGNDCYMISINNGYISKNCSGHWDLYTFLDKIQFKILISNYQNNNNLDDSIDGICPLIKKNHLNVNLNKFFCLPRLPEQNVKAFRVLNALIKKNKLAINLDGSYSTFGAGKYVGVFYKNKQYYFIISIDGIHYEIKPAPLELVSSLAINLFK